MTEPTRYQTKPIELPDFIDAWLYDCTPAPGCARCADEWQKRVEAVKRKERRAAYEASAEVRAHPHHPQRLRR